MPTREEIRIRMLQEFTARGLHPSDPSYAFALQTLNDMNQGAADLDDELADIAARLAWLAQVPTWINERPPALFETFIAARLDECAASLALIRTRWQYHHGTRDRQPPSGPKSNEPSCA